MCAETTANKGSSVDNTAKLEKELQQSKLLSGGLFLTTVALLVSTVALAVTRDQTTTVHEKTIVKEVLVDGGAIGGGGNDLELTYDLGPNPCAGKKPDLPNVQCVIDAVEQTGEQAGANVTKGYNGQRETDAVPITVPYYQQGLCPVNVHWHLGAEHYSLGEYDENGKGTTSQYDEVREGFQCHYYDDKDPKFNEPFDWKHCIGMEVGKTYEVHWPHSAAGDCGTPFQYQTPFYDGVFCKDNILTDTAQQIGVQAQVFTIINDDSYYYPDLFRGMIVDGDKGQDLAIYTGSTTGTSRNNEICSQFAPITWQVDRKCHLISASSFDKLCKDMSEQPDDMRDDMHAHGSRELVDDAHAANNHQTRALRG